MTRRATRKTVDYSQYNADSDNHESDDDFKDSSFPPPSKKAKTSIEVKKANKQSEQGVMKKQARQPGEDQDQAKQSRKSRDEKQFEKELQQALEMSKSNSKDAPQSDGNIEGVQSKGCDVSKEKIEAGEKLQQPPGRHESNGNVDGNKENDDDFHPSSCEDEDEDNDDDFCIDSESDEEFHSSKTKKQKKPLSNKCPAQKRKSKSNDSGIRSSPNSRSSKKCSERGTATAKLPMKHSPLLSSHLHIKGDVKNSSKSASATPTSTLGKSLYRPSSSPGLRANSSSGLGGVAVTSARPGGLRLGLSRNVRIAKPLHSNINIK